MNPGNFHAVPALAPTPPWLPVLPPDPPPSSSFWSTKNIHTQLRELQETLALAKSMQKELEVLMRFKDDTGSVENESIDPVSSGFSKYLEDRKVDFNVQESVSLNAAESLMSKLRAQLEFFRPLIDQEVPWEEKTASARWSDKMLKSKRNKLWRKRKGKRNAEMQAKEQERFDEANRLADEWRAREIAKEAAQLKVEKMKKIAKLKEKEERKKLESELELALVVERLQELRSVRIQKLKKQGHFLPEEDNKFLERVRVAVEEEERQAMAAADTDAAKDAILSAEESRKTNQMRGPISKDSSNENEKIHENEGNASQGKDSGGSAAVPGASERKGTEAQSYAGAFDSVANLPMEFYHYYHGSSNDMGTLIEVRRTWDAYIRPGGSRIPGHWVQPPPPADEVWASYLVRPH